MRVAISNIAWDVHEDEAVAALLRRYAIDAIDVAPGKYFPAPEKAGATAITGVRRWWADRGVEITGMQSLLFGTSGLNLFGTSEAKAAMLRYLGSVCRIGGELGATRLVFGSPKNRDRTGLTDEQARAVAVDFFARLGDLAASHGVCVCIEPCPARYGCNYMLGTADAAALVRAVDHPAIRLHLDTGAMVINGEDPDATVTAFHSLIVHAHASEPDMVPLGDGETPHATIAPLLERALADRVITIEMLATKAEPHLTAIERALRVATQHYRALPA
jgi:sugar phosphate isomerase/epimerase